MQCTMWQVLARSTVTVAPEAAIIEEAVLLAERVIVLTVIRDRAWTGEVGSSMAPITGHSQVGLRGWIRSGLEHNTPVHDGNALCSSLFGYAVLEAVRGPLP
jgi:hypothetical protein